MGSKFRLLASVMTMFLPQVSYSGSQPNISVAPAGNLPRLTSTLAVHSLTAEQAARHYPVHVRGVVTNYEPRWYGLYVNDATGGIFVKTMQKPVPFRAGQVVEVDGVSSQGSFAPTILMSRYRMLERRRCRRFAGSASTNC